MGAVIAFYTADIDAIVLQGGKQIIAKTILADPAQECRVATQLAKSACSNRGQSAQVHFQLRNQPQGATTGNLINGADHHVRAYNAHRYQLMGH